MIFDDDDLYQMSFLFYIALFTKGLFLLQGKRINVFDVRAIYKHQHGAHKYVKKPCFRKL